MFESIRLRIYTIAGFLKIRFNTTIMSIDLVYLC